MYLAQSLLVEECSISTSFILNGETLFPFFVGNAGMGFADLNLWYFDTMGTTGFSVCVEVAGGVT